MTVGHDVEARRSNRGWTAVGALVHGRARARGRRFVYRDGAARPAGRAHAAVGRSRRRIWRRHRRHALPRHRPGDRSRGDRLHVVLAEPAAHARQHHVQIAAARARLRHARLQGRGTADRQLQFPLAARHRRARREEGRRAPAPRAAPRRLGARFGDVQHPRSRSGRTCGVTSSCGSRGTARHNGLYDPVAGRQRQEL